MSVKSAMRAAARRLVLSLVPEGSAASRAELTALADRLGVMELNVKAFGYELARRLTEALPVPPRTEPRHVGLRWKPSTQDDIESAWARHWIAELGTPIIYHRKIWELAYVLQAIWEGGHIAPGARGLGFGCGVEPIASYLASQGVAATVTDQPQERARAAGWVATNQHAGALDQAFHPHLVERAEFDRLVRWEAVDMNAIPPSLRGYDFCWSICAMEHLGSIDKGLAFVERAMEVLRPGGLAVHTTEFDIRPDGPTWDNAGTVLFQRAHLERLASRLRSAGHRVAELDFDIGDKPLDRFIDVPPWTHEMPAELARWMGEPLHLKIAIGGFVMTCFGLIAVKGGDVSAAAGPLQGP
ncbi:MAG: hypothetical protein QOG84_2694 [Sphingomonadales bacterium]|jgi:2-polyprenyl-3-methyl-5-hydroxy-6-metoxy-1,4-benzoquinol methylase|nr:hypothetical protein [Sphingomonadales bacterium]